MNRKGDYNGKTEKQISLLQGKKNDRACSAVPVAAQCSPHPWRMPGAKVTA